MILHICCNLAGSTVFPQLFEALDEPTAIFDEHAWNPDDNCATCKKNFAILFNNFYFLRKVESQLLNHQMNHLK